LLKKDTHTAKFVHFDLESFVMFKNMSGKPMRVRKREGSGKWSPFKSIKKEEWRAVKFRRNAQDVQVLLEYKPDKKWIKICLNGKGNKCNGTSWPWGERSMKPVAEYFKIGKKGGVVHPKCVASKVPMRFGSLSYSFEKGDFFFIQLNNKLGFKSKKPDNFTFLSAEQWLRKELSQATDDGKAIIINVHNHDSYKRGGKLLNKVLVEEDWNVVAVLAGHEHNVLGTLKDLPSGPRQKRKVPVILSGAAFCGTMLYLDMHADRVDGNLNGYVN
tara:strand:- start:745 stop:1560 length:816 start_codon:yes stop_codon:yes gene_type:complete